MIPKKLAPHVIAGWPPVFGQDHARENERMMRRVTTFNIVSIALGLAFLYLPIAILVIYSFDDADLVGTWGGWSTRWYAVLLHDQAMRDATVASLVIATASACAATVLGTCAAFALTRLGRFPGRVGFTAMIYAPLVMPEVITGLSLLLMFVAAGVDRGFVTVAAAHTTLTMCFVTVVVQSRLASFDHPASRRPRWISAPRRRAPSCW